MAKFKPGTIAAPVKLDPTTAKFYAWLDSQASKPPNQKEKNRMNEVIEFDLNHRRIFLGLTVSQRMLTFKNLGYLYDCTHGFGHCSCCGSTSG